MESISMELSSRLQAVADMVTKGHRVADVGCDHAYISIYLIENKISEKVIAMDVNKGPLEIAKNNIEEKGYDQIIQCRLSDGLEGLSKNEIETIIIAGMGGALTCKILKEGVEKLKTTKELVLQPQSELDLVRKYLEEINFQIIKEKMLIDDEKYYLVIKAKNNNIEGSSKPTFDQSVKLDKEVYYLYGKYLLESKDPILQEFLLNQRQINKQIKDKLKKTSTVNSRERMVEINRQLVYIKEGLDHY